MSDDSSRNLSSRVFHVDRECYVVYVGTTDHKFRPFLRLGTSPWLPDKVKRHISNVVISDHLTGNPQYELQCLEHPVSHDMRYVGTTGLVNSVKQFVHDQTIASRPISPPKGEEAEREGAHVLFYSDGNVRVIVDGKEVLDLGKRERGDRHAVFELRRLNELARSSTGAYFASSFSRPGFLYGPEGSLIFFGGQGLDLHRLAAGGLEFLTRRLIPLDLIRRIAGPQDRDSFIDLCKWKLRRKEDLTIAASHGDGSAGEIEDLITLLSKAGLKVKRELPETPPELLSTLTEKILPRETDLALEDAPKPPTDTLLTLPAESGWLADVSPGLLPGLPYELAPTGGEAGYEKPQNDTLYKLLSDALRKEIASPTDSEVSSGEIQETRRLLERRAEEQDGEPSADLLIGNLLIWNSITEALRLGDPSEDAERKALAEELAKSRDTIASEWRRLLSALPLPINGALGLENGELSLTFSLPPGFTKGRISENRRVYQKIDAFIDRREEQRHYQEERRRLEAFLDTLIEKQQVTKVAAPEATKTESPQQESKEQQSQSVDKDSQKRDVSTESTAATTPRAKRTEGKSAAEIGAGAGERGEPRRGRRALWAALVLLLLGGGGGFLFFALSGGEQIAGVVEPESAEEQPGDQAGASAGDGDEAGSGPEATEQAPGETSEQAARESEGREPRESGTPTADEGAGNGGASDTAGEFASDGEEDQIVAVGNGGYEVTIFDIISFVNRVARNNGYAPLGAVTPDSRDPDWIFPGNEITLPDGSVHVVREGDTLWDISRRFLLRTVDQHFRRFQELRAAAESGEAPIERLESLREEVYVASLREAITVFLQDQRE